LQLIAKWALALLSEFVFRLVTLQSSQEQYGIWMKYSCGNILSTNDNVMGASALYKNLLEHLLKANLADEIANRLSESNIRRSELNTR
jgi:hypothetical protein